MGDRDECAVAVFARAPVPGRSKTRLIPALGADGAAALHAWMIRGAVATALESRVGPVALWCTPDTTDPLFASVAAETGVALRAQSGADLGERMSNALDSMLRDHPRALIVGSDAPTLGADRLRDAARALAGDAEAVIGPALDGGYVLIGLDRPEPRLFEGIDWGTAAVSDLTRERLAAAGMAWHELEPCPDVDRPEDLRWIPEVGGGL